MIYKNRTPAVVTIRSNRKKRSKSFGDKLIGMERIMLDLSFRIKILLVQ